MKKKLLAIVILVMASLASVNLALPQAAAGNYRCIILPDDDCCPTQAGTTYFCGGSTPSQCTNCCSNYCPYKQSQCPWGSKFHYIDVAGCGCCELNTPCGVM